MNGTEGALPVNLRRLHLRAGHSARLDHINRGKSHVQNTKLEKTVQESATQNRQGETAGKTGKENAPGALRSRAIAPAAFCERPLQRAPQLSTKRKKRRNGPCVR